MASSDQLLVARRGTAVTVHRLLEQLARVFESIEPARANAGAFGPATRDVLFLACTEVEAAFRGVMVANGHRGGRDATYRFSMRDYVQLLAPMRLNEYRLRLALYQDEWIDEVSPFATWSTTAPTQSLNWYDAYNAAKHDREGARNRATLRAVVDAVAAAYLLLVAQFGKDSREVRHVLDHIAGFEFVSEPTWRHDELYFPADAAGFNAVQLFV